jgi:glycosyltransferase involved in cell wall biosynthesis
MPGKKIKILFLIGAYGTGGKERQLAELIKGLPSEKYECHMLIKSDGAYYLDEIRQRLASLHNLSRSHFGWKAIPEVARVIRRIRPDIVHSWAEATSIIGNIIKLIPGHKFILIDGCIRMAVEMRTLKGKIRRSLINARSDFIISNSKAGLGTFHVPARKSCFIHNGFNFDRIMDIADPAEIRSRLGTGDRLVIGMVARLDFEKDWDTFFEAAMELLVERSDIVFLVIGDGNKRHQYESMVSSRRSGFIFTGTVSDVESYVNIFDIAVLSSYAEGISNSIMEYMALKKPVIASGGGGVAELVLHNESGYIYPVGDSDRLKKMIVKLLEDEKTRNRLGLNGYKYLKSSFTLDRMVRDYDDCYKKLLCVE